MNLLYYLLLLKLVAGHTPTNRGTLHPSYVCIPFKLFTHTVHHGLNYPAVLLHFILLDVRFFYLLGRLNEYLLAASYQLLVPVKDCPLKF